MLTLVALRRVVVILWARGTWYSRLALFGVIVPFTWPITLALVSLAGLAPLTSLLAFLPVISILGLLFLYLSPVWLVIASTVPAGRNVLRWLVALIGFELVAGIYFTIVPVHQAPAMLPLLFLTGFAALFLFLGGFRRWVIALVVLIIAATVLFWFAGFYRAAGTAWWRTNSSVEQCVASGRGFRECVSESVARPAPARPAGMLPVRVVRLDPNIPIGPIDPTTCEGISINFSHLPAKIIVQDKSGRSEVVDIITGNENLGDLDKVWLQGRGFAEVTFVPGGWCPRI